VSFQLGFIVEKLGGNLVGSADLRVNAIRPLEQAGRDDISFLSNPVYADQLKTSQAGCVILSPKFEHLCTHFKASIFSDQPYLYFAKLTQLWRQHHPLPESQRLHPSAVIHPSALIDPTARVGPLCVVESGAVIGAYSELKSRVSVGHDCVIGSHCIVHPGAVIGADGFGFAPNAGAWEKIEQLGAVRIGDHVEIGANTCVDRGALGDTVIEDGVKLDNFIQIAHNVHIGQHTAMAAFVGVSGSTRIGAHCTVAGGAGFVGHIQIADHVHIGAKAVITHSIEQAGHYGGYYPFDEDSVWKKNAVLLRRLNTLREKIKVLENTASVQVKTKGE
jgi:UDP-3-O-[3-hydroxymyristoyl] glucosamine N-acyltransferase